MMEDEKMGKIAKDLKHNELQIAIVKIDMKKLLIAKKHSKGSRAQKSTTTGENAT